MLLNTLRSARHLLLNRVSIPVLGVISSLLFVATLSPVHVGALCVIVVPASSSSLPGASCCPTGPLPGSCGPIEPAEPAPVKNDDVCVTPHTNIAIENDIVSVFSGKKDGNPNGFLVTEIPLKDIRAVTDEEKATGKPIWVYGTDSEFAEGWHVDIYWQDNHYGAVITGDGGSFYDDTNECAEF